MSLVGSVLRADGAVILSGAYIAGQLFCQGTKLCNSVGTALSADGLWTGGNVSFGGDFIADGACGIPKTATYTEQRLYATRSHSLISPPRTSRRAMR